MRHAVQHAAFVSCRGCGTHGRCGGGPPLPHASLLTTAGRPEDPRLGQDERSPLKQREVAHSGVV